MIRCPDQMHECFASFGQRAFVAADGIGMKVSPDVASEAGFDRRRCFASA